MECLGARTSAFVLAASFLMAPPSHAEELQSRVPSYIEADRTQAEETLGGTLANDVFSDRFTALRKRRSQALCAIIRRRDVETRRLSPCRSSWASSGPRKDRRGGSCTSSDARWMCAGHFF